jgi:hypothetical protein
MRMREKGGHFLPTAMEGRRAVVYSQPWHSLTAASRDAKSTFRIFWLFLHNIPGIN